MNTATAPLAALTRVIKGESERSLVRGEKQKPRYTLLQEGVFECLNHDGNLEYSAECLVCGEWTPIFCDIEEIPPTGYEHYCGGSPRCCP